jgi:hypothetical protein
VLHLALSAGEYDLEGLDVVFVFCFFLAGASRGPPEHRLEASRIHFSAIWWFLAPLLAKRRL